MQRLDGKPLDKLFDRRERSRLDEDRTESIDPLVVKHTIAERLFEQITLRWSSPLESEGHEQGSFTLAQIVTRRLARLGRVAEDTENVVAELESLTDRQSIGRVRLDERLLPSGEQPTDVERPLDRVFGRLVADHPQRTIDASSASGLCKHVEILTGHQLGPHVLERRFSSQQFD